MPVRWARCAGVLSCALIWVSIADGREQLSQAIQPQASPRSDDLPQDVVADDNTRITRSCRLILPPRPLVDADNNGVIQIVGDDITVDLQGNTLVGSGPAIPQNEMSGIGILVTGKRVTLRNGVITGYKVGVAGRGCDNATFEGLAFARNYAQALKSDSNAEDAADWLWPHANDGNEWESNYGAALSIASASGVTIRDVGVRAGQNGILLSRTTGARVYGCDASFLSGWGIALWRSSGNTVCANSFDFCIRGYSHEIYNRGQDSAGILCFEQSSDNTFIFNSATHCGDGFFSFAGREALGEVMPSARSTSDAYAPGQGCNRNLIAFNDFSDAAAHGIETTFSTGNRVLGNRCDRDAICGVWGGYSRDLLIAGNTIRACGTPGSRGEGGGVNIEHGMNCTITDNYFSSNSIGVSLWWDEDSQLGKTPWAQANGMLCTKNCVTGNAFNSDSIALMLRKTTDTYWAGNKLTDVPTPIDADESSAASLQTSDRDGATSVPALEELQAIASALSTNKPAVTIENGVPTTTRSALAGRAAIAMGEFGPYDYVAPLAVKLPSGDDIHNWKLLGPKPIVGTQVRDGSADIRTNIDTANNIAVVTTETLGHLTNYTLQIYWGKSNGNSQTVRGTIWNANWRVCVFPLPNTGTTPPSHVDFDKAAQSGQVVYAESLKLPFGMGGPQAAKLISPTVDAPALGNDYFGLRASCEFNMAPGNWLLEVRSDDGVRVTLDDKVVLDEWTHHGPTTYTIPVTTDEGHTARMTVEYFELAGNALLEVRMIPANSPAPGGS